MEKLTNKTEVERETWARAKAAEEVERWISICRDSDVRNNDGEPWTTEAEWAQDTLDLDSYDGSIPTCVAEDMPEYRMWAEDEDEAGKISDTMIDMVSEEVRKILRAKI